VQGALGADAAAFDGGDGGLAAEVPRGVAVVPLDVPDPQLPGSATHAAVHRCSTHALHAASHASRVHVDELL